MNAGCLELGFQPEARIERGFLHLRSPGALLQLPGAEMNRRRDCKQGDTAHGKQRRTIGLPGCKCALRDRGGGEKHEPRHRPAHGAKGSVNCH